MTYARFLSAAALAATVFATQPALAAEGFSCPAKPIDASMAASIQARLPTGDAFDKVEALNTAVDGLRADGVSPGLIVDGLIAAYCPVVAEQSDLTEAQKRQRVVSFAMRATRTVYALDSADAIIVDAAVPPAVANAIDAKAKAAGVTSEDWIRGALESAVQ